MTQHRAHLTMEKSERERQMGAHLSDGTLQTVEVFDMVLEVQQCITYKWVVSWIFCALSNWAQQQQQPEEEEEVHRFAHHPSKHTSMHKLISSVKNLNYNIYGGYVPELLRPLLHHIYIQSSIVNSALCKHVSKRNDIAKQKQNVICFDISVSFFFLEIEDRRKKSDFPFRKKGVFLYLIRFESFD